MRARNSGGQTVLRLFLENAHCTHGSPALSVKEVVAWHRPAQRFRRIRPLVADVTRRCLFYLLRLTESDDRHALPKLSDPLLLTGEHPDEGEWVE